MRQMLTTVSKLRIEEVVVMLEEKIRRVSVTSLKAKIRAVSGTFGTQAAVTQSTNSEVSPGHGQLA